ncbi:uncharacterized protein L203_104259 [Cryptococcus depauperatus CBS 7841]|uniref:UV radiation resistance-associated gene protein n=1 Tax=Cryptococcus depauperatus CBS 7841 TaxID=1295531 RepID=A0AAJ8JV55_9TREE
MEHWPRVRDITGIRIHQLTLPESLPYAFKLKPEPIQKERVLGEPSRTKVSNGSASNDTRENEIFAESLGSQRRRKSSNSTLPRKRSASPASTTVNEHPSPLVRPTERATRVTRNRASTLAGEAMELNQSGASKSEGSRQWPEHLHGSLSEQIQLATAESKKLARCFIVLRTPERRVSPVESLEEGASIPSPKRAISEGSVSRSQLPPQNMPCSSVLRSQSSSPIQTLPTPESSPRIRQRQSMPQDSKRNTSPFTSPKKSSSHSSPRLARDTPLKKRPSTSTHSSTLNGGRSNSDPVSSLKGSESPAIPFFISTIHPPSLYPRFFHLNPESDFASWLSYPDLASTTVEAQVWVQVSQDEKSVKMWKMLDGVGGLIRLDQLKRQDIGADRKKKPNCLEFTLSFDPKGVYYMPSPDDSPALRESSQNNRLREGKLKRGAGIGALHQLVNLYAVVVDTQRGISQAQDKVDKLLAEDADHRSLNRELSEREDRIKWIRDKVDEVKQVISITRERLSLQYQASETKRDNLAAADRKDDLLRVGVDDLEDKISSIQLNRFSLLPKIYRLRASLIQTLDTLFPIQPLDPSILLYTILDIPLPIPATPNDPAPPIMLPAHKVDERTTAAALGYVAMVVQILGNIGGQAGGLAFPVTCAGSRSVVKDVASVMQGPRSFPLYAKGVERYRYEYGVFLLNKNIEMLMQEANIRLLDIRQTLPNLKSLLLTLSSPVYTPIQHRTTLSSRVPSYPASFINSTSVSRVSSGAWYTSGSFTENRRLSSSVGFHSPPSSSDRTSPVQMHLQIYPAKSGQITDFASQISRAKTESSPLSTKMMKPETKKLLLRKRLEGEGVVNLDNSSNERHESKTDSDMCDTNDMGINGTPPGIAVD